jgi:nonsense-mediated mRNA decay protein 3
MEGFMRDLEEDPELRSQVNLYKEKNAQKIVAHYTNEMQEEEADFPEVGLEELLDDLTLNDHDN